MSLHVRSDQLHTGRRHHETGGVLDRQPREHASGAGITMAATRKGAVVMIMVVCMVPGALRLIGAMAIGIVLVAQVTVVFQHMGQHLRHARPLMHLQRTP